jgi:hypothetical protein
MFIHVAQLYYLILLTYFLFEPFTLQFYFLHFICNLFDFPCWLSSFPSFYSLIQQFFSAHFSMSLQFILFDQNDTFSHFLPFFLFFFKFNCIQFINFVFISLTMIDLNFSIPVLFVPISVFFIQHSWLYIILS